MPRKPKAPPVEAPPPLSLIPASVGWRAVFQKSDGRYFTLPVAAWQRQVGRIAGGLVSAGADFNTAASVPGFVGYLGPDQSERDNLATWFAPRPAA